MAVIDILAKRYYCDGYQCYYTSWDSWIRWVVLVVVVVLFLILFFACSCTNARRRRRQGNRPYYGTGWTAPAPRYDEHQNHQAYYNNNHPPPPEYTPNAGQGYYGQQSGIELQQPPQAYAAGRSGNSYEPPLGPPPAKGSKGDGIIR